MQHKEKHLNQIVTPPYGGVSHCQGAKVDQQGSGFSVNQQLVLMILYACRTARPEQSMKEYLARDDSQRETAAALRDTRKGNGHRGGRGEGHEYRSHRRCMTSDEVVSKRR
ncbi:hypothetical protein [Nesterenkonia flava]|uniref:Transposase n=1 Tax=Nesterenkonia flava TaxID=469799 RepID=A0ABU1FY22_9MICC|nr:hypothetical protein [Nesterenkonia flava]MDR5713058.1 hypothetical protein [Nesterenkonia flava]